MLGSGLVTGSRLTLGSALVAVTLNAGAALAQQQQAGVAAAVRGRVEVAAAVGAVGREVKSGEAIYLGNAVKSAADSGMQIMLLDQTTFTIGPNSEITIDQFVFDPATGTGKVAASVAKGVFRFVTGKVAQTNPSDMSVRLPTGNIGIRGTIAVGAVDPGTNGQPLKQEVVLLGPGGGREGSARVGAILLADGGGGSVAINQPGFGSQFSAGSGWGTPVRYTAQMINALQSRLDTPIAGKGPGPGAQGPGGRLGMGPGFFGPGLGPPPPGAQGQQRIVAGGAQDRQRCVDTGACPGGPSGTASTFEQLRSISSGQFYYSSSGSALSDGGTYSVAVDINFANRTVGGGDSHIFVDGSTASGAVSILSQSFASGSGTASFTQSGISGLSGTLCSPSCSTSFTIAPQNSSSGIATSANHSVAITGTGTVTGSGTATRQSGSALGPPL